MRVERSAVDPTLARLVGDHISRRITFDPVMDTHDGYGRSWAELLYSIQGQLLSGAG
ncbi:hypothetical protein GCM10009741_36080 [Kribbella lupini]|uniref:Uncharacterized protein n=1 Tax=Kribbella lupini TaxID=291602 RepID=A0ABP4LSK1_9ACTN